MKNKNGIIIGIVIGVIFLTVVGAVVGLKILNIHEHTFSEATCKAPSTCSKCGETRGEALPHTVRFGKCDKCGELQNEELAKGIVEALMKVNQNTLDCAEEVRNTSLTYRSTAYSKYSNAVTKMRTNTQTLEKVISLCGDYEELKNIKENCQKLVKAELKLTGSSVEALRKFLLDFTDYLLLTQDSYEILSDFAELYK